MYPAPTLNTDLQASKGEEEEACVSHAAQLDRARTEAREARKSIDELKLKQEEMMQVRLLV